GRGAIVVLTAGLGRARDYDTAEHWAATIARYENRLLGDLDRLAGQRRIDRRRVIVAGSSLGGDLAWALALRNPDRVCGAVVMASRASYRVSEAAAGRLRERGLRFYFTMGTTDAEARRAGALAAAGWLEGLGVASRFRAIEGLGHEIARPGEVADGLAFVAGGGR
ncbi:MAG TPA: hypothetical protein VLV15_01490, partial [Dongiaceae bacterium]|nr:hypothetical protein [Dongiaceae bacterium]